MEEFIKDTLKSGQGNHLLNSGSKSWLFLGLSDVKLVEVLAQDSTTAIDWVTLFGVDLDVLSKCGGHSVSSVDSISFFVDLTWI